MHAPKSQKQPSHARSACICSQVYRVVLPPRPPARHDRTMKNILRDSRADDLPAITAIYGHAVRTGLASFEYDPA